MTAISFNPEWLDALLSCDKQQTTRPQRDRFRVGDMAQIYIQQRRPILGKPIRKMTYEGIDKMFERSYPYVSEFRKARYHAHYLGVVRITEVYDIKPRCMDGENAWAVDDGFFNIEAADKWFAKQYGEGWRDQTWTVVRWDGWQERYFSPEG